LRKSSCRLHCDHQLHSSARRKEGDDAGYECGTKTVWHVRQVFAEANMRYQDDLVDQLCNSSEKRLARVLLLMAHFGKEGISEMSVPRLSQETISTFGLHKLFHHARGTAQKHLFWVRFGQAVTDTGKIASESMPR
jgi:hypothetical protein